MNVGDALLVLGAGVAAGAVNAAAGGGTLITFPALLAVGLPALGANVTSSVGLLGGYLGGSLAYRRELRGQGDRRGLLVAAAAGGALGAVLLLVTPASAFRAVVPWLLLASVALLLAQPAVARRVQARRAQHDGPHAPGLVTAAGVLLGCVYGGYFGAGLGVVLLAILGAMLDDDLQRLNALKGVLSLLTASAAVLVFLASARVAWAEAGLLFVASAAGGALGVGVARRLAPVLLRVAVGVLGAVVAVVLLVR